MGISNIILIQHDGILSLRYPRCSATFTTSEPIRTFQLEQANFFSMSNLSLMPPFSVIGSKHVQESPPKLTSDLKTVTRHPHPFLNSFKGLFFFLATDLGIWLDKTRQVTL